MCGGDDGKRSPGHPAGFNYCRQQHFSQTNLLHSRIYRHYWFWQSDRSGRDKTLQNKAWKWIWITLHPQGKVVLMFVSLNLLTNRYGFSHAFVRTRVCLFVCGCRGLMNIFDYFGKNWTTLTFSNQALLFQTNLTFSVTFLRSEVNAILKLPWAWSSNDEFYTSCDFLRLRLGHPAHPLLSIPLSPSWHFYY